MKLKNRAADKVLSVEQLRKSRIGQVKNGDLVLIPPYLLRDLHALRHVKIIMTYNKTNIIADGELRANFWRTNIFDPASYKSLFKKLDDVQTKIPNEMGIVQAICAR